MKTTRGHFMVNWRDFFLHRRAAGMSYRFQTPSYHLVHAIVGISLIFIVASAPCRDLLEKRFGEATLGSVNDAYRSLDVGLSVSERNAINDYRKSDYLDINSLLRTGTFHERRTTREELTAQIEAIDAAMLKAPRIPANSRLHRGVVRTALERPPKVGDVLVDKGYLSTTASAEVVESFTFDFRVKIKASGGSSVAVVKETIAVEGGGNQGLFLQNVRGLPPSAKGNSEHELLIHRGSRRVVIDVKVSERTLDFEGNRFSFPTFEILTELLD